MTTFVAFYIVTTILHNICKKLDRLIAEINHKQKIAQMLTRFHKPHHVICYSIIN
jgi:hypothetical protein